MKTLKTIILLTLTLMLSSCGTSHNYTNKPFNKDFYKNQTIYLKLNPSSQDKIKFSGLVGTVLGGISQPDVKETFRTAIAEIADETKINVRFFDENLTESGEQNLVFDTTIKEINWHFGISVATLQTKLDYRNSEKEITTVGIRKSGGGDEMNNLKKSLKDAIFKFLQDFEK